MPEIKPKQVAAERKKKMKKTLIFIMILTMGVITGIPATMVNAESVKTIYVSTTNGNNQSTGETEATAVKTLATAYSKLNGNGNIVLLDNITYSEAPAAYTGNISIKGKTSEVQLTLPSTVSIKGNLEIDNVKLLTKSTIYANGYKLVIGNNVTSESRLTVYGGKASASVTSTDITLLGGLYERVYGGGNSGAVSGNTNVVFGGNWADCQVKCNTF